MRHGVALGAVALAALAAAAAGGSARGADQCPATNWPDSLVLQGGTPQSSKIGSPFESPFQVALANSNGCPVTAGVAGVPVTFSAPASGASGTFEASGSNTAIVGTNAQGVAAAPQFTANRTAGDYTVAASSQYGSVTFALNNTASGVPATIGATGAASESAAAGARYPQPLQATVTDVNGNPIEGVMVTFSLGSAPSGGGGGSGAGAAGATFDGGGMQATELTDASGTATSPFLTANGVAGGFSATAATAGVVEPASFALHNLAGKAPLITALAPAKQSATVSARYRKPLEVTLRDGNGKPLQGATVTFSLGSASAGGAAAGGGGSAGASFVGGSSQASEVTDAAGIAASPLFTANTTAGRFTATATTTGTTDAASFALDNLAAKSPALAVVGRATQSAFVGGRYGHPLQVRVRDGAGKPLEGASVTFTLGASGGGGGSGTASAAGASFVGGSAQVTETTTAAGIATSPRLIANTSAGTFTATATTSGSNDAASFNLRNLAAKPTTITPGVAASESTGIGTRFPIRFAVTVTDAHDNPVADVDVTFAAPARGPSGRFTGRRRTVTVRTDAKGVAIAPAFVANRAEGGYVVRATAADHAAAFALVNQLTG